MSIRAKTVLESISVRQSVADGADHPGLVSALGLLLAVKFAENLFGYWLKVSELSTPGCDFSGDLASC